MRKMGFTTLVLISVIASCIFLGCATVQSASFQKENEMYLQFKSSGMYVGKNIRVLVDEEYDFEAKSYSTKTRKVKAYGIKPGNHIIEIFYEKNLIAKKQIFGSMQETKIVEIP